MSRLQTAGGCTRTLAAGRPDARTDRRQLGARARATKLAAAKDPWQGPFEVEQPNLFYDRFETFDSRDGLPSDKTTAVLAGDDELWVGTDRGLALRRQGTWTSWNRSDGLAHDYVTSLAADRETGDVWISTLGGLSVLSGGSFRSYSQLDSGLMNDVVYQVMVLDRTVWAATAAGRQSSRPAHRELAALRPRELDHARALVLLPDRGWCGRVWIGIWGAGIVELELASGQWREYRDPDKEMEIDLLRDDGPIHDVTSLGGLGRRPALARHLLRAVALRRPALADLSTPGHGPSRRLHQPRRDPRSPCLPRHRRGFRRHRRGASGDLPPPRRRASRGFWSTGTASRPSIVSWPRRRPTTTCSGPILARTKSGSPPGAA